MEGNYPKSTLASRAHRNQFADGKVYMSTIIFGEEGSELMALHLMLERCRAVEKVAMVKDCDEEEGREKSWKDYCDLTSYWLIFPRLNGSSVARSVSNTETMLTCWCKRNGQTKNFEQNNIQHNVRTIKTDNSIHPHCINDTHGR